MVQTYPRDMGGGVFILLKEFDAPITVRGRHWGAVRLAIKP
jgi:methyl-accepting chemotaxis protein